MILPEAFNFFVYFAVHVSRLAVNREGAKNSGVQKKRPISTFFSRDIGP